MIYKKYKPSELLGDFVECYFVWHSDNQQVQNLVVESPPSGRCSIVFNLGEDYHLSNKKYDRLKVPRSFVSGQNIYSYKLFLNGVVFITGIVLRPTGLSSLFNFNAFQFSEERVPLEEVMAKDITTPLSEKLSSKMDPDEIAKTLDHFMVEQFRKAKPIADIIDRAANSILDNNGMMSVSELMRDCYMSRRNFERKFLTKVGLSPKYYARIARISYLMNLISGKRHVDWKTLFNKCSYYDQSHFIKDFLEFTGRTPQQYLEGNSELANYVDKPVTRKISY